MTPFFQTDHGKLYQGYNLDVMPTLPENSIDAILTDPPYGLGFMGKKWDQPGSMFERQAERGNSWDHVGVNHNPTCSADAARTRLSEGRKFQMWCEEWAREALRVCKPGAHLLAFGGPRTHHRLMVAIEDAGWEIRDTLGWIYGQGFPKGQDVAWETHKDACVTCGFMVEYDHDNEQAKRCLVVPCCKFCNRAKDSLSLKEFYGRILRIYRNRIKYEVEAWETKSPSSGEEGRG